MKLNDKIIKERRVEARLEESEIGSILLVEIAKLSGISLVNNAKTQVRFYTVDKESQGFKFQADITIINSLEGE